MWSLGVSVGCQKWGDLGAGIEKLCAIFSLFTSFRSKNTLKFKKMLIKKCLQLDPAGFLPVERAAISEPRGWSRTGPWDAGAGAEGRPSQQAARGAPAAQRPDPASAVPHPSITKKNWLPQLSSVFL